MLRLLPKDVVNYIYELVHKSNTQDIVDEYKCNSRAEEFATLTWFQIYIHGKWRDYNFRKHITLNDYVYNKHGYYCSKLPERYKYSLTRQEFQSMSMSMSMTTKLNRILN